MRARRLSKRNFPLKRDSKSDRVSERARVRAEQTTRTPTQLQMQTLADSRHSAQKENNKENIKLKRKGNTTMPRSVRGVRAGEEMPKGRQLKVN